MNVFCIVNQTGHLSSPTRKVRLDEPLAYSNSRAHSFRFTVLAEGSESPADLTGVGVTAQFLRSGNNTTVSPINGTVTGNVCEVILPASCYNVPGRFTFTMDIAANNESRTVLWVEGIVERNMSGDIIDPGTPVPNITEAINNANAAASAANSAATAATTAATAANTAATETANVNISQTKTDGVIAITTTDRNGTSTTTTVVEPTATVTKEQDGPYHLTVTDVNGTTVTDIPDPAAEVKKKANRSSVTDDRTISGTGKVEFPDALDEPMSLKLELEPKQDLHGYDKPWVGGVGKNKLRMTLSEVKTENSGWTWNGNQATKNGVTVTVNADGDGNVLGYIANANNASENTWFKFTSFSEGEIPVDGTMKFGGYLSSNGNVASTFGYQLYFKNNNGSNIIVAASSNSYTTISNVVSSGDTNANYASIVFRSGLTIANLEFKPMILLSTETDYVFEPYSNICPIEGYDSINVTSVGKNLFPSNWETGTIDTSGNPLDTDPSYYRVQKIKVEPNCNYYLSFNGTAPSASSSAFRYFLYNADGSFANVFAAIAGPQSITTGTDTGYISFRWLKELALTDIQLEKGSVATSYEPFGSSLTLNLTSAAGGTVYGGTVTVNEDGSGELVVDKARVLGSQCTWSANASANTFNGAHTVAPVAIANDTTGISSAYIQYRSDQVTSKDYGFATSNNSRTIFVKNKDFDDVSAFTTHVANVEFVYGITPQSYPLTASQINSLLGYTQVITDTDGALTVGYKTDKYAKLEKFLAALPSDTATGDPAVFTDGADGLPMKKLTVDIQPKQDLHGYDKPWVGGSGKNLLPLLLVDGSKNGVSYTIKDNGTVVFNGTADSTATGDVYFHTEAGVSTYTDLVALPAGNYKFSGISGGSNSTYRLYAAISESPIRYVGINSGVGEFTLSSATKVSLFLRIYAGATFNNVVVSPMIYAATASDTFEPYSNICPITGWDKTEIRHADISLFNKRDVVLGKNWIDGDAPNRATVYFNLEQGSTYHMRSMWLDKNKDLGFVYAELAAKGGIQTLNINSGQSTVHDIDYVHAATNTMGFIQFQWNNINRTDPITAADLDAWDITLTKVVPSALPISLKSITGSTVYGGTLTVNADGTGELVVDRAIQSVNGLSFSDVQSSSLEAKVYISASLSKSILGGSAIVCDKLAGRSFQTRGIKWSCAPLSAIDSTGFAVFAEEGATKSDIIAKISDANICYVLASPTTYPLTATQLETLLGTNTVWCDAGEVTVEYCVDLEKYIEKRSSDDEHFPGDGKLVAGTNTQATRNNAVATGNRTTASGANSHAEGNGTTASGQDSHAEGQNTTASQGSAHAEGISTTASGYSGAHAEGAATEASGQTSHAEGFKAKAQGKYSHAQGNETTASGESSNAEGYKTVASGKGAHAEGQGTKATVPNSHAEGGGTTASGQNSHAEGGATTASAQNSHAEGGGTTASGTQSHAEGAGAMATGQNSHAEGTGTIASSMSSHAEGTNTLAYGKSQHVFGEFNVQDGDANTVSTRATYVEIVGNGTVNARSNARTLDWNGNEALAGGLTLGKGTADEITLTAAQLKALLALLS